MTKDNTVHPTAEEANKPENQANTIVYFLDYIDKMNHYGELDTKINLIVRNNIAKGLVKNPNLQVSHLERLLTPLPDKLKYDLLKDVLAREDRRDFIHTIFSFINSSEEDFSVYWLGKMILFDKVFDDYHCRALDALSSLKFRKTYHMKHKECLPGPCLSYLFFIQSMLNNAVSADEANWWLEEYRQLEELFVQQHLKSMGNTQDSKMADTYRKRAWIENYLQLAGNHNLPYDYLKQFQTYVEENGEEYQRVAIWGKMASNPGITAREYRTFFEKKKLIKEKSLVNNLLAALASNPEHYHIYYDDFIKYLEIKPTNNRHAIFEALARNPGMSDEELNQLLDILVSIDYNLKTRHLNYLLIQMSLMLSIFFERKSLKEEHHEKIRIITRRFLDRINDDTMITWGYINRLEDFSLHGILSRVRLNREFIDYLFTFSLNKYNGGMFLSGLLPNPDLSPEDYDRIVAIIEKQYVGKEAELLTTQKDPFWIEKVYTLWPASKYVC